MKLFQQLLVAGAAMSMVAPMAQASNVNLDDMKSYSNSSNSAGFTNNYSTIEPTDFVHQSINDLAKSRGCSFDITGRSISRYEAATIINSCLGDVAEVTTVERSLIDEFSSELALIRGRIDGLEARMNEFEAGAFSSTTTLDGKAVFNLHAINGNEELEAADSRTEATSFAYVYQMNLNTSFTGDDNLYVRLKNHHGWGNTGIKGPTYLNEGGDASNDNLEVDKIWYTFPVTDKLTATVGPRIENYYMLAATPSVYKAKVLKGFRFGGHGAAFGASTSTGAGLKYDAGNGFATSLTLNDKSAASTVGLLTEDAVTKVNLMGAYTQDNYHVSATFTSQRNGFGHFDYYATQAMKDQGHDVDGWALRAWWRPDETGTAVPSVSVGYDTLSFDSTVTAGDYREGSGYSVGLNWNDLFQPSDTVGLAFGQPIKGDDPVTAGDSDVDAFLWELYYSFKPNDSIEVVPAIFGGSDVLADTEDDIFGAMLQTTFKF